MENFLKFQEIFDEDRILNGCSNLLLSIEPLITVPIENEKPGPLITFFMGKPGIYVLSAFLAFTWKSGQICSILGKFKESSGFIP